MRASVHSLSLEEFEHIASAPTVWGGHLKERLKRLVDRPQHALSSSTSRTLMGEPSQKRFELPEGKVTEHVTAEARRGLHAIVELVFFDAYLANSPVFEDRLRNPNFISACYQVIATGPMAGRATGVLIAALTWLARWFLGSRTT